MGLTSLDQLNAKAGRLKRVTQLPSSISDYYDDTMLIKEWQGGEIVYHSGDERIYIQTATSGTTPTWKTIPTTLTA